MKAKITSTNEIVTINAIGFSGYTKARVWDGMTEGGIPFTAYIPVVQVAREADNSEFERELTEHVQPSPETMRAIDARLIL